MGDGITAVRSIEAGAGVPADPVLYQSFYQDTLRLRPWFGRNIVFLVDREIEDREVMERVVFLTDAAYDAYAEFTGWEPGPWGTWTLEGRGTIAVVPRTCGAACALVGAKGIELLHDENWDFFGSVYNTIRDNPDHFDHILLWEFGRNFWFLHEMLEYADQGGGGTVATGFGVFMRYIVAEMVGVTVSVSQQPDGPRTLVPRSREEELVRRYDNTPEWNWYNTLSLGPYSWAVPLQSYYAQAVDLLAALLLDLEREYRHVDFARKIWREAGKRPRRITSYDAIDNMVYAASAAADANLGHVFSRRWRWPVSESLQAELLERFGTPVAIETLAEKSDAPGIDVYPNPSRGFFSLSMQLPHAADVHVVMFDVLGRRVSEQSIPADGGHVTIPWESSNLPAGLYFIRVTVAGRATVVPITVQ